MVPMAAQERDDLAWLHAKMTELYENIHPVYHHFGFRSDPLRKLVLRSNL